MEDFGSRAPEGRSNFLRESGRSAILDQVAHVLVEGGLAMSMSDLAEAAGIGRATLYRYFPNRQALLDSIISRAVCDLKSLVASSGSNELQTRESLTRFARAVLAKAGIALIFMRERIVVDKEILEKTIVAPLNAMIEDAQNVGIFKQDIPSRAITFFYLGLLRAGIMLVAEESSTVEESAAHAVRLLFDGCGCHSDAESPTG